MGWRHIARARPDREPASAARVCAGFCNGYLGRADGPGPTADTGLVGFEVEPAKEFAGGGAVGGGRLGGEEFGQQGNHRSRPLGLMVAAGDAGRPDRRLAVRRRLEVLAVAFIKAGAGKA